MDEKRMAELDANAQAEMPGLRTFRPEIVLELIAEVRRLRELVNTTAPLRLLADLEANRAQDIRDARSAERERIVRFIESDRIAFPDGKIDMPARELAELICALPAGP